MAARRPLIFGEVLFDNFPDQSVLGGAPFNVGWNFRGFGNEPLMISAVGDDDPGHRVREAMKKWNMTDVGLQTDPDHPTGAVEITMEGTDHTFNILPDRAYDHIQPDAALAATEGSDIFLLYHGSLAVREAGSRAALDALREKLNLPRFIDVNLRKPWYTVDGVNGLVQGAEWVKLNNEELEELAGAQAGKDEDYIDIGADYRTKHGIGTLIVTLGDRGAASVTEQGGKLYPTHPVAKVVDTVGAGDGFSSIFLVGIMQGWKLDKTMKSAVEHAAMVCGIRGATTQDPRFYFRALKLMERK